MQDTWFVGYQLVRNTHKNLMGVNRELQLAENQKPLIVPAVSDKTSVRLMMKSQSHSHIFVLFIHQINNRWPLLSDPVYCKTTEIFEYLHLMGD